MFIILLIVAIVAFIVWLNLPAKKSPPAKPTASTSGSNKDPQVDKLKSEIYKLQSEKNNLESSIRCKDALIKQKDNELNNYRNTDAQKRISELETSLKTAQQFRDKHWAQLTALKKEHENYVKTAEAELKKAKEAATPVSVSKQNRLQDQQPAPSQHQIAELNGKIKALEQVNETHKNTISSLKQELTDLRKTVHSSTPMAEEERRYYEEKVAKLNEELKEPT